MKYLACLCATLFLAVGAEAHHSAAAFDRSKPFSMQGTINKFIFSNPHAWIHVDVPNGKGGADVWVLEGPGLTGMSRSGWTGKTLQKGDKVKIVVAPRRDGTHGGEFMAVWKNGQPLKF